MSTLISDDRHQSLTSTRTEGRDGVGFLEGDWQERLAFIDKMMREMSQQDDPQAMVRAYGSRVRKLMPGGRRLSLGRRGLQPPRGRNTRWGPRAWGVRPREAK